MVVGVWLRAVTLTRVVAWQGLPRFHKGMFEVASSVWQGEGARGLFRGLCPTLLQVAPYSGVCFGVYDALQVGALLSHVAPLKKGIET